MEENFIDGIPIEEYRINMAKIPHEELFDLYKIKHKNINEIARHFNCSYRTIYRRLKRLNIQLNTNQKKGRPKKKPKQYLGKKQLAELLEKDLKVNDIALKVRSTPEIVRKYIHKYGL